MPRWARTMAAPSISTETGMPSSGRGTGRPAWRHWPPGQAYRPAQGHGGDEGGRDAPDAAPSQLGAHDPDADHGQQVIESEHRVHEPGHQRGGAGPGTTPAP